MERGAVTSKGVLKEFSSIGWMIAFRSLNTKHPSETSRFLLLCAHEKNALWDVFWHLWVARIFYFGTECFGRHLFNHGRYGY